MAVAGPRPSSTAVHAEETLEDGSLLGRVERGVEGIILCGMEIHRNAILVRTILVVPNGDIVDLRTIIAIVQGASITGPGDYKWFHRYKYYLSFVAC